MTFNKIFKTNFNLRFEALSFCKPQDQNFKTLEEFDISLKLANTLFCFIRNLNKQGNVLLNR
jgi:hypothetical protein